MPRCNPSLMIPRIPHHMSHGFARRLKCGQSFLIARIIRPFKGKIREDEGRLNGDVGEFRTPCNPLSSLQVHSEIIQKGIFAWSHAVCTKVLRSDAGPAVWDGIRLGPVQDCPFLGGRSADLSKSAGWSIIVARAAVQTGLCCS